MLRISRLETPPATANALHGTALNAPIDHCRRAYAYVTNKQKYVCFFSDRVRAAADGELEEQEEKTECVPFSRRRRRLLWGIMLDKPIAFRWLALWGTDIHEMRVNWNKYINFFRVHIC